MAELKPFGGIGRALGNPAFRTYWFGNLGSTLGFWIFKLALGWFTWELTHSPAWLGGIAFASTFPIMVLGPIAGALADQIGARLTAIAAMTLAGLNGLLIAALVYSGQMSIGLLLFLAALQGVLVAFDFPARMTLISKMVRPADLSAAIGVNSATFQSGGFIGPVIGGFIVVQAGIAAAFAVYALSIFWMLAMLALVRVESGAGRRARVSEIFADVGAGFRYVFGDPGMRSVLALHAAASILLRPFIDLLPGFADIVFHRGAEGLATMIAAAGLGALIGSSLLAFRGRTRGLTRILLAGIGAGALFLMMFSATTAFSLALVFLFAAGFSLVMTAICSLSLIQNSAAPDMRGRVISLAASMGIGGAALGALVLGWIADIAGLRVPLVIAGGAALLLLAWLSRQALSQSPALEAEPEVEASATLSVGRRPGTSGRPR